MRVRSTRQPACGDLERSIDSSEQLDLGEHNTIVRALMNETAAKMVKHLDPAVSGILMLALFHGT